MRVSTDDQDLTAQRDALAALDIAPERIYVRPRPDRNQP
jgi:DNA invertase Pin-like site-specific DNA recombinase